MHKSFPFQRIFTASLPTFQKGVHCTEVLHPLARAVQCAVRFSTLWAEGIPRGLCIPLLGVWGLFCEMRQTDQHVKP